MSIKATKINKIILNTLLAVGFVSVALVAPNALQLFDPKKRPRLINIKKAFESLVYSGCIKVIGGKAYLTVKGRLLLGGKAIKNFGKTEKWDKQWHVVSFDIPEKIRWSRSKLRITLKNIGFVKLQNSLWAYPYNCKEFIYILKKDFKIGKEVIYMIVDEIEKSEALKKHFKLR
jgi:CRISPR-associated endonuclease Cas2